MVTKVEFIKRYSGYASLADDKWTSLYNDAHNTTSAYLKKRWTDLTTIPADILSLIETIEYDLIYLSLLKASATNLNDTGYSFLYKTTYQKLTDIASGILGRDDTNTSSESSVSVVDRERIVW